MNTENKSKNTIEKSEYATKYVFRERGITASKKLPLNSCIAINKRYAMNIKYENA